VRAGTRLPAGVSKGKRGWDFLSFVSTYSDLLDNKKDVSLSKVFPTAVSGEAGCTCLVSVESLCRP
jgi:hypothetical protein